MYIKVLFGRYAGQVMDIEPVTARALLASGRGEDPNAEVLIPVDVPVVAEPAPVIEADEPAAEKPTASRVPKKSQQ